MVTTLLHTWEIIKCLQQLIKTKPIIGHQIMKVYEALGQLKQCEVWIINNVDGRISDEILYDGSKD